MTGTYRIGANVWIQRCILALLLMGTALFIMPQAQAAVYVYEYTDTREALVSYLSEQAASQPEEIEFEFADELYDIISDSDRMTELLNEAGILSCRWSYNTMLCTLSDITFMPPHVMCKTEDDICRVLYCAVSGEVNIRLTPELYAQVSANEFEKLFITEGKAGVLNREMTYYESTRLFEYSEIQFAQNFNVANTAEELKQILKSRADALTECFAFYCPPELFERVTSDGFRWLDTVESNCGILNRDVMYYNGKKIIVYSNVIYYPGMRVVKAMQNGWTHILSEEDKMLYDVADRIAKNALATSANTLELEIALHDAIAQRTVYELNASGENIMAVDTAFGALIEGRADCEGYSDAFYLLGTLAGLNVGIQHGVSLSDDSGIGHLWNLLEIDGKWYIVDVTWDDSDNGSYYAYMNIGRDLALMEYEWDETASLLPLAETTNPYNYYYVINGIFFDTMSGALDYVNGAIDNGVKQLTIMVNNTTGMDKQAFLDELYRGVKRSGSALSKHLFGNALAINMSFE